MAPGFEATTVPGAPVPPGSVRGAALVEDRAARAEREGRLLRLAGPGQLRAAVLALLLTGSRRELAVWRDENKDLAGIEVLRSDLAALSVRERTPWMERFTARLAREPQDERRRVLHGARRLMAADGRTDPRDRLRWLGLRHALAGATRPVGAPPAAQAAPVELENLDEHAAHAVVQLTAFLSRLVPVPEQEGEPAGDDADLPSGLLWWRAAVAPWHRSGMERGRPDADALVHALRTLQGLPWMMHPVLVRRWLDAAVVLSPPGLLHPDAAEALRTVARLLDSPLPPALAACFDEGPPEPAPPPPP